MCAREPEDCLVAASIISDRHHSSDTIVWGYAEPDHAANPPFPRNGILSMPKAHTDTMLKIFIDGASASDWLAVHTSLHGKNKVPVEMIAWIHHQARKAGPERDAGVDDIVPELAAADTAALPGAGVSLP